MRHAVAVANGIRIHYVEEGAGPLIVLLHGFPEFWYAWRDQIPTLADAGFRVIAPDLRGYNLTERPIGVDRYRMERLVDDVAELIGATSVLPAFVVGHDWGGVIAWYLAMLRPERVRKLVILNAPHPAAYRRELRKMSSQMWRSMYAGFFQIPLLPEVLIQAADFAVLRQALRSGPARTPEEVDAYVAAFSHPGAVGAALNYYRAALRHPPPKPRQISTPTRIIWGERDAFLVPELTEGLERWVRHLQVERLPDATHWLHHEQPEVVSRSIEEFAREG